MAAPGLVLGLSWVLGTDKSNLLDSAVNNLDARFLPAQKQPPAITACSCAIAIVLLIDQYIRRNLQLSFHHGEQT